MSVTEIGLRGYVLGIKSLSYCIHLYVTEDHLVATITVSNIRGICSVIQLAAHNIACIQYVHFIDTPMQLIYCTCVNIHNHSVHVHVHAYIIAVHVKEFILYCSSDFTKNPLTTLQPDVQVNLTFLPGEREREREQEGERGRERERERGREGGRERERVRRWRVYSIAHKYLVPLCFITHPV